MTKTQTSLSKYFALAAASFFLLSACNKDGGSASDVIMKAKQALTTIESGEVMVDATVAGGNATDDIQFTGDVDVSFDNRDEENRQLDVSVVLSGEMKAGERVLDGDLDMGIITMGKQYYLRLNKLASSDPSIQSLQPLLSTYQDKWLRISEDFIPENIRDIQEDDPELVAKREQLEELFVNTELFTVTKDYGIEKLSGHKVYHYGLEPSEDGFRAYMKGASVIDGQELTTAEIDEALEILDYIKNVDLYIDTDDYYVRKSVFLFTGEAIDAGSNLGVEVTVTGDDYNESVNISEPSDAEDFNPLNLMMGLGGLPTGADLSELEGLDLEGEVVENEAPAEESAE